MKNIIISIICMFIGSFTGLDFYIEMETLCGLCLPSIYFIGEIYEKINKNT